MAGCRRAFRAGIHAVRQPLGSSRGRSMKSKSTSKTRSSNGTTGDEPRGIASALLAARWPAVTPPAAALISRAGARRKAAVTIAVERANAIPIFLIEDNRLPRDGLKALLDAEGLKVVATARNGAEALRQVTRRKPQLVLLDSSLAHKDSLRFVEAVKKRSPAIKVIVMHLLPAHRGVVAFVRAGVSGFIMKDASVADFVATVRAVADGANVLPPLIAATLFSHVATEATNHNTRSGKAAARVTNREREVIALIAEGLGNREIGGRLRIAAHTVKSHVHNILEKLSLHTRLEVAAYAHANPAPI
jgi:DNA-binding NarL/FixJ family response regulator